MMKWWHFFILVCGLFFITACGGPKNVFVLMPDAEDGSVGQIHITNQAGEQTISTPGSAVNVKDAQTAPNTPKPMAEDGIRKMFKGALGAVPRPPAQFILQFKTGTSTLTDDSQNKLSNIVVAVIDRQPCDISIIGHTDTRGTTQENIELGLQRANMVKQILMDEGVEGRQIVVSSHGESSPNIPTEDEVDEPRNRRVEVLIR